MITMKQTISSGKNYMARNPRKSGSDLSGLSCQIYANIYRRMLGKFPLRDLLNIILSVSIIYELPITFHRRCVMQHI